MGKLAILAHDGCDNTLPHPPPYGPCLHPDLISQTHWRIREGDQRGWMRANLNSSHELSLYPKSNRHSSLLTWLGPHSYRTAISHRTGLETSAETQIGVRQNTSEIDDKNWIKEQFIFSQAFHRTPGQRVRGITTEERFEPRILESFDPTTQESNRLHPATIHTQSQFQRNQISGQKMEPVSR
jgi:hypothetical protein